ncbi:MAG: hypothetical protein ABJA67_08340 [Chthonomonadales bacterium]
MFNIASLLAILIFNPTSPPDFGDLIIRGKALGSEIVISTSARFAGAISTLTWNGKQFIDTADHGRELQSASSFQIEGHAFWPEAYNPTEAGSRDDGDGKTTTSKLVSSTANRNKLTTISRMAYWLKPGELSEGNVAINTSPVSAHLLKKSVEIGIKGFPNVIRYEITFTVPGNENIAFRQFEALTGYMPAEFDKFTILKPAGSMEVPTTTPNGEQSNPVIVSTQNGSHAMGAWSPAEPSVGFEGSGYGHFRFPDQNVNKWNVVFREKCKPNDGRTTHTFVIYVAVGTLKDVESTLTKLVANKK